MINQMHMSPNRLIDVQYQALTYRAFTSFPHSESHFMLSLPLSFIPLIMAPARWLRHLAPGCPLYLLVHSALLHSPKGCRSHPWRGPAIIDVPSY
jgi:hypothetical protein